jgi:hypothetical protein
VKYVFLSCIVIAGCAASGERPNEFASLQAGAKSVCQVTGDPGSYLGRRILIQGILLETTHERMLYDPGCPDSGFRVSLGDADGDRRAEAMVKRFRKLHPTVWIPVVYSGVFSGSSIIHDCTTPSCYVYSLEESRLMAASPHRMP